jgi:predicted phosphodiesterase
MLSKRFLRADLLPLLLLGCGGCLSPTPFSRQVEETDLNARNLKQLEPIASDQTLRFAAISDTHAEYDDLQTTVRAINARHDLQFVAHMGDQTDMGLLEEYQWTWEVMSDVRLPMFMTLGNHDAISSGWKIYRDMYGPYDWSFVHGHVKFIFFNSNTLEFPDSAPQQSWLESELTERQGAEAVVLVTHHPPIDGDAGYEISRFYRDLLLAHDVVLWLHGHVADFQLRRYYGIPVLQTGTYQHHREHQVVTIEGRRVSFELCKYDECRSVEPESTDMADTNSWQL